MIDDPSQFQGLPQSISVVFEEPISLSLNSHLAVKFQGGFVGSTFRIILHDTGDYKVYEKSFYPDDINDNQLFRLEPTQEQTQKNVVKLKIIFEKSSDFFGRIIIYNLGLHV